jgi:chemotaxis family two-component system response regulator Rcp1
MAEKSRISRSPLANSAGHEKRAPMNIKAGQPIDILLVEDNPGDVRLTIEVLKYSRLHNDIYVARDGVEALSFLRRKGEFVHVPRPDLILLDLNLPKKDGREVLAEIKNDDALKSIPVVILTTSETLEDILEMYGLHANFYITKPVDLDQFIKIVQSIEEFWLTIVKLPE